MAEAANLRITEWKKQAIISLARCYSRGNLQEDGKNGLWAELYNVIATEKDKENGSLSPEKVFKAVWIVFLDTLTYFQSTMYEMEEFMVEIAAYVATTKAPHIPDNYYNRRGEGINNMTKMLIIKIGQFVQV